MILGAVWKIEMLKDLTYLWTNKKYDTCGKSKTCGRTEGNNVHENIFCFTKPNAKSQTILRLNTMSQKGKFHTHTHTWTTEIEKSQIWETKMIWRSVVDWTKVTLDVVKLNVLCVSETCTFWSTAKRAALSLARGYSYVWVQTADDCAIICYNLLPCPMCTVLRKYIVMKALKNLFQFNNLLVQKIARLCNISVNSYGHIVFGIF